MSTQRRLSDLRASDFAEAVSAESIFVLPVGAIEQHGPHLPFSTDLLIAEACAEAVVKLGHGGNSSLLNMACRELRLHHGLETFLLHPSLPPDQGGTGEATGAHAHEHGMSSAHAHEHGMGIHAGFAETSLMLHLRSDLVRMDIATRNVPAHLADNDHLGFGGSVTFGWLAADFGETGVIGDPTGANTDVGEQLFNKAIEQLTEAFAEIKQFAFKP